jgi:aryl-alcohol dehydrogenase-like predicted oxidoreductase
MQQHRLGSNGPLISALGLGCMGMSGMYGPATRAAPRHAPKASRRCTPRSAAGERHAAAQMSHLDSER